MKTNIESIYKNMKPNELVGIAFAAIGAQDETTLTACEASVPSKTYVGRDINYTEGLHNRVSFAVVFGLYYHKAQSRILTLLYQRQVDQRDMKQAKVKELAIRGHLHELLETTSVQSQIQNHLLYVFNQLCEKYGIDKKQL